MKSRVFSGRGTATSNFHIYDGTYVGRAKDVQACYEECLLDSGCLGLDFDNYFDSCYLHDYNTVCGDLNPLDMIVNVRLVDCNPGPGQSKNLCIFH